MGSKEVANPIVFCLAVFNWSITSIYNSNIWPERVIPTFRSRKSLKCGQNYRKIQNLLKSVIFYTKGLNLNTEGNLLSDFL